MNEPRHPLTPEIQSQIVALVRAGGFPHVAAVASGVPVKVFEFWLRCGRARRPQPLYRDFLEAIQQAQAQARLVAETQALRKAPLSWLRFGPGRQTGRLPGWTDAVKPPKVERHAFAASVQRMQELVSTMLDALEAFPEARAALAQALDPIDWLKEDGEPMPEAPPEDAPKPAAELPTQSADAPSAEPLDEPPASARLPDAERQSEPASEPASNPQPTATEPATNPQPTGNETAAPVQPTGKENAPAPPVEEPKPKPAPRKPAWNPWGPLDAGTWTVVWRLQR